MLYAPEWFKDAVRADHDAAFAGAPEHVENKIDNRMKCRKRFFASIWALTIWFDIVFCICLLKWILPEVDGKAPIEFDAVPDESADSAEKTIDSELKTHFSFTNGLIFKM